MELGIRLLQNTTTKSYMTYEMVTFNLILLDLERSNSRSQVFQQGTFPYWIELRLCVLQNTTRKSYVTFKMVAFIYNFVWPWKTVINNFGNRFICPVTYRTLGPIFISRRGDIEMHSVRPSVRPSVRLSVCLSVTKKRFRMITLEFLDRLLWNFNWCLT